MSRREEEETPPKRGLFGGLFYREKPEPETPETGRARAGAAAHGGIVLGDDAEEPQADLELVLEPEEAAAEQPVMPEPKKQTLCHAGKGTAGACKTGSARTGARETGRTGKVCGSGKARGAGEEKKRRTRQPLRHPVIKTKKQKLDRRLRPAVPWSSGRTRR